MGRYFSATDISASGLAAERFRMEIDPDLLANFTHRFEPSLLRMGYDK